ncbi:MAG: RNA-binding protein [Methylocella sp.]
MKGDVSCFSGTNGKTMPKGPKGEKRPADVIGNAVHVMRILTGEEPEDYGPETGKNQAAAELGRIGGKKRAEGMTHERRVEIAKKAAAKRWITKQ